MAQKKTASRKRTGRTRSTSSASGEVREEMRSLKKGRRKNAKQAIAIGLSKARRKGKDVPAPKQGTTSAATRKKAQQDAAAGRAKKSARKTAAKKSSAKKSSAKKSTTKRSGTKRSTAKKSTAKRGSAKKTARKRS